MADVYMHGKRGSNSRSGASKKKSAKKKTSPRRSTMKDLAKGKSFRERAGAVQSYDFGADLPLPPSERVGVENLPMTSSRKPPRTTQERVRARSPQLAARIDSRLATGTDASLENTPLPGTHTPGTPSGVGPSPLGRYTEGLADNRARMQARSSSAENPFQRGVAGVVNAGDAVLGAGETAGRLGLDAGRGIVGGVLYGADQIYRGASTGDEGFLNRSSGQGASPQQQNGSVTPQQSQGQGAATPQRTGPLPGSLTGQDAAMQGRSTLQNAVDQAARTGVPIRTGNEGLPPGTATYFPGSGDNAAARQGVFDSIDERAALGRQAAQGRIARGVQIDPVTGERTSAGGGNQGTMFGRFEGVGGMNRQMRQQYDGIQNEIDQLQGILERGARTDYEPGRPGHGARRGLSVPRMQAINARLGQLQNAQMALIGSQVDLAGQDAATERTVMQQMLSNQGGRERTAMQGQNTLDAIQARIQDPLNQQRARAVEDALGRQNIELPPVEIPDIAGMGGDQAQEVLEGARLQQRGRIRAGEAIADAAINGGDALQAFNQMRERLASLSAAPADEVDLDELEELQAGVQYMAPVIGEAAGSVPRGQGFAAGGLVGAPVGAAGGPVSMPSIQNYQQYVQMARQMGVDPVGLQEFSSLSAAPSNPGQPPMPNMQQNAQASQNIIGMADGGMVPSIQEMMQGQVDGKVVMDADPNAPVDSIPATIDGQQPARLDSGEFVIPADVVMHFGTDKLTKMIEQARNAAAGGQTNTSQGNPNG